MIPPFIFDKTNSFCISLDSRSDRWERMRKQFEFFDMDVQRWSASTPTTLIDPFFDSLNSAERACSQSHINIYRHILKNNLEYALILEDDGCFNYQWKDMLENIYKQIPSSEMDRFSMILLNASEPIDALFKWVPQKEQYLTGGYIISNRGAKWILDYYRDMFASADWMTTRLQLYMGCAYSFFPWLIIQEGKDSNIGTKFNEDHAKVVDCLYAIDYSIQKNYYLEAP